MVDGISEQERQIMRVPTWRQCCADAATLRKALAEIERAEANGFPHCMAVLMLEHDSSAVGNQTLRYSDLWERASIDDGRLDWGRGQDVTKRFRFDGEKLVPIEGEGSAEAKGE